jgi:hypothetical protein
MEGPPIVCAVEVERRGSPRSSQSMVRILPLTRMVSGARGASRRMPRRERNECLLFMDWSGGAGDSSSPSLDPHQELMVSLARLGHSFHNQGSLPGSSDGQGPPGR